jgi:hypothetical protein
MKGYGIPFKNVSQGCNHEFYFIEYNGCTLYTFDQKQNSNKVRVHYFSRVVGFGCVQKSMFSFYRSSEKQKIKITRRFMDQQ